MGSTFGAALGNALLPEIILASLAAVCALLGLLRRGERPDLYRWIAVLGLAGAVAAAALTLHATSGIAHGIVIAVWGGGLVVDDFSIYVTVVVCAFSIITCLASDTYLRQIPTRSAAFSALVLLITAAVSALAAERDMVTMFLTLELMIVGMTALQALIKPDDIAAESAWKYFVEGAVATAVILYGLVILYGVTGSTSLSSVAAAIGRAPAPATLGITLVLLGLTFPLGIVPLRQWISRAGEATPAVVAGFCVTFGITAGAVAVARFGVSGLGVSIGPWLGLAAVLAAIALVHAALTALRETRVTRVVGAMASAQAALLLLAALSTGIGASHAPAQGGTALVFAVAVFGVALLATFVALAILQAARFPDAVDEFRGLGQRSPYAALLLAFALAALAGVPPAAGFVARLFIVESAVDAGYGWLGALGIAAVAVAAVPVIRLIAVMYAEPGAEQPFTMAASPRMTRIVAGACCAAAFLGIVVLQPLLMLSQGGAGPLP